VLEVGVIKLEGVLGPGAFKPRPVSVASAHGVSTREADNGTIIKAHSVEHITEVLGSLGSIGKATVGGALATVGGIGATTAHINVRAA
jgi:hypothetical protein